MTIEEQRELIRRTQLARGEDPIIISIDEWKRRKIIWETENTRPKCKNCWKKLTAKFGSVYVQRFEPKESFNEDGDANSDSGIRQKTDYSKFRGFGHRLRGIFCNGRCCKNFAYRVCDQFERGRYNLKGVL